MLLSFAYYIKPRKYIKYVQKLHKVEISKSFVTASLNIIIQMLDAVIKLQ